MAAMVDARMRENIVRAAQRVNPDFVTSGRVWPALVSRMPTVAAVPDWAAQSATMHSDASRSFSARCARIRLEPRSVKRYGFS